MGAVHHVPVFINCRDRVTPLRELVAWCEQAGLEEIVFIDNDSAYEPLLEYYRETPHTVVRLDHNYGSRALWAAPGLFERTRGGWFVYTDPDVIPDPAAPLDALDRFRELLERYALPAKAGFGLRTDDIPLHYKHRDEAIACEAGCWDWPLEGNAYFFPIDTTFALYRPGREFSRDAIRTGPPYVARHDSWYLDFDDLPEEVRFYRARAESEIHWSEPDLDEWHRSLAGRREDLRPTLTTRMRWRVRGRRAVRKGVA